jgi:hypothetical protein
MNNIMKSGPGSSFKVDEPKPAVPEKPKDYDNELAQQKQLIQ